MKKTLIALIVLAGVATAQSTDVTFTTTNSITTSAGGYTAKGFLLNLNGTALTSTSTLPSSTTLDGLVQLESMTLNTGTATAWAEDGKFSLVITDTNFSIVGWSTTVSTASTNNYTWSFVSGTNNEAVILDSDKEYLVLADSSTSFTLGSTLIKNNKQMRFNSTGVIDYGANKLDFYGTTTDVYSGLEFVTVTDPGDGKAYASYNLENSNQHAPNVTIVTKLVPEPATATLSLLALCGLAARRRRR